MHSANLLRRTIYGSHKKRLIKKTYDKEAGQGVTEFTCKLLNQQSATQIGYKHL